MEIILISIAIIVAAGAGFYFGKNFSNNAQEKNRIESELKEKQQELDAFRNKVTSHFEKTANLFNQVSDSYQSLYDHIATSSNQLCSTQTFQSLPKNNEESALESQPLPVHKTNTDSTNMFDANRLYNAHDYRNQEQETSPKDNNIDSTKVVDIESAKEDKSPPAEPALDYAIKADGVINHNSLNSDNVKTQS
ncbi:YhcB family protein [Aliikangiella sp. IMCC44359]|uniref:YhcB family protein n=1 Tax=Aliikangiella sp. IMCC44359 TaxID=3459125 RepID=UPI00403B1604